MSTLEITSVLSSLVLAQASPAVPESSATTRLKLEGGVDVYYGHNFPRPADASSFIADTGTTATRANEFSLNLATLGVSVDPAPVGFRFLLVLVTVGFFALGWAYAHGCERLSRKDSPHDLRIHGGRPARGAAHRLPHLRPAPSGALLRRML